MNFDSVIPDDNHVFVHTSGIPHYTTIGPWANNPNDATDQNKTFYITRSPREQTGTKTATRLGAIGTWIDGTAIFNWSDGRSFMNQGLWNRIAIVFEGASFDACDAHPPGNGQYHTHGTPTCLVDELGDDGSQHSPILGWSFDGFPIYGSYGYVDGDPNAGIERIESSWQLRNIAIRPNGPPIGPQPLGNYFEDFEYVVGSGDLDEHNGRFSPTPDYPEGIYHYYVTIDAAGEPVFPYAIGPDYYGVVDSGNTMGGGAAPTLDQASISVAAAGDVNHDEIDDFIVGDPDAHVSGAGAAGVVYVIHGSNDTHDADTHLHTIDVATGHRILGDALHDETGFAVGPAGDVNSDGISDLIVGSPSSDISGSQAGESTLVLVRKPMTLRSSESISTCRESLTHRKLGLVT